MVSTFSPRQAQTTAVPFSSIMPHHFKQVAIIGVGLIGGSLGLVLKHAHLADTIVGVGRRVENLKTAIEVGAIDRYVSDAVEGVRNADLVVLATPVDTYERHLKEWGHHLSTGTIVTDVGSVKGSLVEQAERLLPEGVRFVGAHPIAGREKTGAAAASVTLFQGARCILTPTPRTDSHAMDIIRDMWQAAGSRVSTMDPFQHDRILGAVSHLPHIAAFALVNTLLELGPSTQPGLDLLSFGGGGLRDTTRIAASSPEMWRDILLWNRDNLVTMIGHYERQLQQLKQLISTADGPGIERELERAKTAREQLKS